MTTPILELEHIEHAFHDRKNGKTTFSRIDLTLHPGEIVSILGPSGAGKSTLLHCIAGFHPIHRGTIRLLGKAVSTPQHTLVPEKRHVGIVFQDLALFPHLTVEKNITFALDKKHGLGKVGTLLTLMNLTHLKKKYPHQISGGEQQRVALARALAPRPPLLLLDEAFSHLDRPTKEGPLEEYKRLLKDFGISVIHVTHDQAEAFSLSDRIALMAQGTFLQVSTPEALYFSPRSRAVLPFTGHHHIVEARPFSTTTTTPPLKLSSPLGVMAYEERSLGPGERAYLVLRPEDLVVSGEGPFEGRVTSKVFKGGPIQYEIDFQGLDLTVSEEGGGESVLGRFSLGERLRFRMIRTPSLICE